MRRKRKLVVTVQQSNQKIRDLTWQLELLVNVRPEVVKSVLAELEILVKVSGEPPLIAKAILDFFFASAFCGMTKFLTILCDALSLDKPDPVVTVIIKSWLSLVSSFYDDDLFLVAENEYVSQSLSSQNEIFLTTTSGTREGFAQLFSPLALYKYGLSRSTQNPERDEYGRRVFDQLTSTGPYRKFSFTSNALVKLDQMKSKVANFTHVIDYVMDAISVSIHYHKPIKITPILLIGTPGIGKSYFASKLSQSLDVPYRRVAMDNLQLGAGLTGSSYIYSNSETGAVFKVLTEEHHISPLVILDEIDKVGDNFAHGDPLSPLHNLLEPHSAKTFEDASFALPIDASRVIWIATANYIDKIPATLQSRFEIFEIASQSRDAQAAILASICEELASEYLDVEFDEDLICNLVQRTPREQRQMLQRALSQAIRLGESKVSLRHLDQAASGDRLKSQTRQFGFRSTPDNRDG